MEISGRIVAAEGESLLELVRWTHLCRSHPNLKLYPPRIIRNPFKPSEFREIPSRDDTVMLVVADVEQGSLSWTQDENERVVYVTLEDCSAIPIVRQIASAMSAVFVEEG